MSKKRGGNPSPQKEGSAKVRYLQIRVTESEKERHSMWRPSLAGLYLSAWVRERLRLQLARNSEMGVDKLPFLESK